MAARIEPVQLDGRRRRSQDSRARIVAAMLDLIQGGEITPSAELVAERAGVGLRTVFRHFKDMDSLYREIAHAIEVELLQVAGRPFKARDWRGRVLELIERRGAAYERIAPFKRAAAAHRHRSRFLDEQQTRLSGQSRRILEHQLSAEVLADTVRLETLDLLLSYEAWSRLRHDQGLTLKRAQAVLAAAVRHVLGT